MDVTDFFLPSKYFVNNGGNRNGFVCWYPAASVFSGTELETCKLPNSCVHNHKPPNSDLVAVDDGGGVSVKGEMKF